MWKKIERRSELITLQIGDILTQDENGGDIFRLKNIDPESNYVTLAHHNGKTEVKMMPADDLIKKDWWLKEK